ncbi:MAG: LD-carboxypeptidase [Bacteroidales bacterium]|nr:LD-carboxypeptidase [Bacteroidales bacterium]
MNEKLVTPPVLKKGDKIGLISTARKINEQELNAAVSVFEGWGLSVEKGKNIHASWNQFAGTDSQRLEDLQYMLDNPEIKAVVCARGGYGTARIIDPVDFSRFRTSPKWIVGYSDVTALHSHIQTNFGIETLHAVMPLNFPQDQSMNDSVLSLKKALFEGHLEYKINNYEVFHDNDFGKIEGILTGGNLSMLYSLIGSDSDIATNDKVLFIEELDEYLYHVDRMMLNLKRSGKLSKIQALMVGWMNDMNDNSVPFGQTAKEIIKSNMADIPVPVVFGIPAGHQEPNLALILGRKIRIISDKALILRM